MSWQRTSLALMVGIAAAVHYVAPDLGGPPAVLAGVAGIAIVIIAYAGAHRRYSAATTELTRERTLTTVSAWPLLLLAVACAVGASIAIVFAAVVLL